jgi:parallel beta-helix repeat protein
MKRKIVPAIMLTLLLTSMSTLAFNIQRVKASGTIYIRVDGSVERTDKIITADNVTYTFIGNITDSIVVERDNIVVDGASYVLQGTGDGIGIYMDGRSGVTVKNAAISNFGAGVLLEGSNYNSISGNNITANIQYGIHLVLDSCNNTVYGNNIANNGFGIWLDSSSNNKIYHNNFINNGAQVYSETSTNVWDDGYPSGGNYWSDYEEKYPDAAEIDGSGIWDTPYVIDVDNQDRYPLMRPWSSFVLYGDVNGDGTVNILDVILVSKAFGTSEGDLNFDPSSDLNQDGRINVLDMILVAKHFGQHRQ